MEFTQLLNTILYDWKHLNNGFLIEIATIFDEQNWYLPTNAYNKVWVFGKLVRTHKYIEDNFTTSAHCVI